ncbi:MAG: SUMF1/EgtB/PvdO family nonheme iron enzyme [Alphaproteobacteria bacterium]|nr:SUMF1/EgtB/PvdO family nonheme iron enzyme [Alphaproteobacteria bacterium]
MTKANRFPGGLKQWALPLCALGALVLANCSPSDRAGNVFQDRFTDGSGQGPEMVVLPSGSFIMGSPSSEAGRNAEHESPQRTVEIGYRLAVGRYEVTVDEYRAFVTETGRSASGGCWTWDGSDIGETESASWQWPGFVQSGNHPVTCVSWDDALAYVEWLNRKTGLVVSPYRYRLLSEAEWEYAARAGSTTAFSFGDDESQLGAHAWFEDNSNFSTQPVGGKRPNGFGLYDMHGNVWEWVEDCGNESHAGAPTDGSARTTGDCSNRVLRGGSWVNLPQFLRSANRIGVTPGGRGSSLGFRLARTLPESSSSAGAAQGGLGSDNNTTVSDPCASARADWPDIERATDRAVVQAYRTRLPEACTTQIDLADTRLSALQPSPPPASVPSSAIGAAGGVGSDVSAEAQSRIGEVFRDRFTTGSGQGPEMVVLQPGSFTMGSPASEPGRALDEGPQLTVQVEDRLAVGRYEVTFAEWDACVAAGGCNGYRPDDRGWGRDDRPVIRVSWNDALAYADWLNQSTGLTGSAHRYRLLSEAEWEYAARAGTTTAYSFGEDAGQLGAHAWFAENSNESTQPVGGRRPNAFGLYDMHGNVQEWVEDCWNDSHSGVPTDGSAQTKGDCSIRVFRGGSWFSGPLILRSSNRNRGAPSTQSNVIGFRLARTLPESSSSAGAAQGGLGSDNNTAVSDPCASARADWPDIERATDRAVVQAYRTRLPEACTTQIDLADARLSALQPSPPPAPVPSSARSAATEQRHQPSPLRAQRQQPSPVRVEKYIELDPLFFYPIYVLRVRGITDDVELLSIVVDRGSCTLSRGGSALSVYMPATEPNFPISLQFGRSIDFIVRNPSNQFSECDFIEVEVETTNGSWTANW